MLTNLRMLRIAVSTLRARLTSNVTAGMKSPTRNVSWNSWTRRSSGTTTKSEMWAAARTVFTRSESISENDVVRNTAESAPRIEASAATVEISGCDAQ